MRHAKHTFKVGRNGSHRRCLIANLLKSLVTHGRIETTVTKAKELRRHADKLVTLAKGSNMASKKIIAGRLMLSYNKLTTKEARKAKSGDTSAYNDDRLVLGKLEVIAQRNKDRPGGYTRIIKHKTRVGDNAPKCFVEYL